MIATRAVAADAHIPADVQDVAGGDGDLGDARGLRGFLLRDRPGCSTPLLTSMLPATTPLPPSVPPLTSIELACEPMIDNLPPVIVVPPA